jgi:hypothetical protein
MVERWFMPPKPRNISISLNSNLTSIDQGYYPTNQTPQIQFRDPTVETSIPPLTVKSSQSSSGETIWDLNSTKLIVAFTIRTFTTLSEFGAQILSSILFTPTIGLLPLISPLWQQIQPKVSIPLAYLKSVADEHQIPLFLGEFGCAATSNYLKAGQHVEGIMKHMDDMLAGYAQWDYAPQWVNTPNQVLISI